MSFKYTSEAINMFTKMIFNTSLKSTSLAAIGSSISDGGH